MLFESPLEGEGERKHGIEGWKHLALFCLKRKKTQPEFHFAVSLKEIVRLRHAGIISARRLLALAFRLRQSVKSGVWFVRNNRLASGLISFLPCICPNG